MMQLFNAAGPILFGISIILVMKAIVPGFIPPQCSTPNKLRRSTIKRGRRLIRSENVTESQSP